MNEYYNQDQSFSQEISRAFFRNVYGYMFAALGISGVLAYVVGGGEQIMINGTEFPKLFAEYFLSATGGLSLLFYVVAFAPLILGMVIQGAFHRMSLGILMTLFIAYSVLMGLSLSTIFIVYTDGAIASTFFVAAGAFGAMAVLGYTTKTDLTKFGSLLYMVFIGMFIAMMVNWFIGSSQLDYIISFIGVFVFTGLTAYYMQQLKHASYNTMFSEVERNKLALIGGLQLYILFVNLFLSLLRILGGSRD
jgi:FtsH-binding integral membrane protein